MSRLRELLAEAAESLSRAGVSSPQVDAEELAAHLLGVSRTQLRFTEAAADFPGRYRDLVAQRAAHSVAALGRKCCFWSHRSARGPRGVHSTS